VLSIAGSDSGGGAGVQADLKTFAALGCFGTTAITALTAQNTLGVRSIHAVPLQILADQIDAVAEDIGIDAVKIGMLHSAPTVQTVSAALDRHGLRRVVLDPVMVATSGAKLLADDALDAMRTRLLPRATIATPNLPEAELLLGTRIDSIEAMREAANALRASGADAVLLKGGHLQGGAEVVDILVDASGTHTITHPRLALEAHGTGCTLASAIAARIALGDDVRAACIAASDYVHRALSGGYRPGRSDILVLDHFGAAQ
jgi:hydroxymethylpyrimidine/phosphomethylpyrimidine kinase